MRMDDNGVNKLNIHIIKLINKELSQGWFESGQVLAAVRP